MGNLCWKGQSVTVDKPWGSEQVFTAPWRAQGKVIYISKNQRTSLKSYARKDELLLCLSGKVVLECLGNSENPDAREGNSGFFVLNPGDQMCIFHQTPYRLLAQEDSVIIETNFGGSGNAEITFYEDDYNRFISPVEIKQ